MGVGEPVLTERVGGYTTRWYVEPPREGDPFVVTRQEWDDAFDVRRIYEWRPADLRCALVSEPPPLADDLELHGPVDLELGYVGWDWFRMACDAVQTLALILIAVALIVRL